MADELTEEETIKETKKHIDQVAGYLALAIGELHHKMNNHDQSKLESPELEDFMKYTSALKGLTYGSEEYKNSLKKMDNTIKHHHQHNRHHPEYFENGIDGMTLMDLTEMICDWIAATKRHDDGDIEKSLKVNKDRFNINPQLLQILKNTVDSLEGATFLKGKM